MVFTAIFKIRL